MATVTAPWWMREVRRRPSPDPPGHDRVSYRISRVYLAWVGLRLWVLGLLGREP